jgi:uncharacterized membrane protein YeaQ/YmgE (transglycosylase-associated protein family)
MNLNIDPATLLIWLGAGGLAGLLTYTLIPGTAAGGVTAALLVGLLGGLAGGFLGNQSVVANMINIPYTPIILAVISGLFLVLIQKLMLHQTKQFKTHNPN